MSDRLEDLAPVHFIGIGGAGMSGLARIMLARGLAVSGSDAKDSPGLRALAALGARVAVGHDAAQLGEARTVVVSSAVRAANPELVAARERGLRVLHRSEALAALMSGRRAVAVAGTHGKTTTTAMVTVALQQCGADPSFAIGGELTETGVGAHDGTGDVFVAEADESDGSFLNYAPTIAIITNVEPDHLDHYGTPEAVEAAFDAFCDRVVPGGLIVGCADDPGSARVLAGAVRRRGDDVRVVTYGRSPEADVRIEPAGGPVGPVDPATGVAVSRIALGAGSERHVLELHVPGAHNALNAAAAWTAVTGLGLDPDDVARGLGRFRGTRRRFEPKGEVAGVRVFDDYAHHPTEVAACLRAARAVAGSGRVVAAFQPHLFSRTRIFATEFGTALGAADEVVVLDVFAAREAPEPGVSGDLIARAVPLPAERVRFEPSWAAVPALLAERAHAGDLVLTIGAGDVTLIGPQVLALLAGRGPA